jgi:hypothetical protein
MKYRFHVIVPGAVRFNARRGLLPRGNASRFNGQFGVQTDPNGLLYMRARYRAIPKWKYYRLRRSVWSTLRSKRFVVTC